MEQFIESLGKKKGCMCFLLRIIIFDISGFYGSYSIYENIKLEKHTFYSKAQTVP